MPSVAKPKKIVVPLAIGLTWRADPDYIYQEKLDGRFETRRVHAAGRIAHRENSLGDTLLAGEYVRGEFFAFDLITLHGEDCRLWPLRERLAWLDQVFQTDVLDSIGGLVHRVPTLNYQPSTLNEILAAGGEGIVRKRLDAPWGTPMEACKRLETFICVVTGINAGQSVQIALTGAHRESREFSSAEASALSASSCSIPCGSVSLFGGKCDQVRVGSIIKVEGFGLTREGKIREPRPCKDTPTSWLIQY